LIIGTWNLEAYASRLSARGEQQTRALSQHDADLWFLTELHADWAIDGHSIHFAAPRPEAPETHRKAAISTAWPMTPIPRRGNPVEGRLSMARILEPSTDETILAVCSVLPWRGATPRWRDLLDRDVTFADVFVHVLDYVVNRIHEERRDGEAVIWGGDFNQALAGRDYVGSNAGRAALASAFEDLKLQVPTMFLPAHIEAHPAIDHIAVPVTWELQGAPQVHRPFHGPRPLSDHALYVVEAAAHVMPEESRQEDLPG
jgi:endonuclease/exonuclease/phosphatase family metal-dependent hydrolase